MMMKMMTMMKTMEKSSRWSQTTWMRKCSRIPSAWASTKRGWVGKDPSSSRRPVGANLSTAARLRSSAPRVVVNEYCG